MEITTMSARKLKAIEEANAILAAAKLPTVTELVSDLKSEVEGTLKYTAIGSVHWEKLKPIRARLKKFPQ
jgi:hypothetical protein